MAVNTIVQSSCFLVRNLNGWKVAVCSTLGKISEIHTPLHEVYHGKQPKRMSERFFILTIQLMAEGGGGGGDLRRISMGHTKSPY